MHIQATVSLQRTESFVLASVRNGDAGRMMRSLTLGDLGEQVLLTCAAKVFSLHESIPSALEPSIQSNLQLSQ